MVGDWIADKDGDKVCVENIISSEFDCYYGIDVVRMNRDGRCDRWTVDFKEAQPIPLTEEILTKNADIVEEWMNTEEIWAMGANNDNNASVIFHEREGWRTREKGTPIIRRYVHELQHALRLCGIEKDIVL